MIRIAALLTAIFLAGPLQAEIKVQDVKSPSGIKAWLVEEHSIPFVSLEIRFKGGANLDAPGKRGVTNMMMGLIEEGAGNMDARAFAAAQESLAASYGFGAYNDSVSISAKFLTENRDKAVDLLRTAILKPRFDPDAIERVRAQILSNIKSDKTDPQTIANRAFDKAAFGDHPYGSSLQGTLKSVAGITRDDLVAAHRGALARDRLYVGAVGDITADELAKLLDELLGALPAKGAPMIGRADYQLKGGVTVIPFDTPQSVVVFGQKGITRDDPRFFDAYILNQILGGSGFNSRLMTEVREKRGLTYGVYTYLVPMDLAETYMGQVSSANDRVAKAIEVIRDEWTRAATKGVTAEELQAAKTYLTGAYPLRFDGNGPIADIMVGMQMQGLPIDYIATRNDKINAVTLESINKVAREILHPDQLHFFVVGQPVGLTSTN